MSRRCSYLISKVMEFKNTGNCKVRDIFMAQALLEILRAECKKFNVKYLGDYYGECWLFERKGE